MDIHPDELGNLFRLIPKQFAVLKQYYLDLFGMHESLVEKAKEYDSVIYGETEIDGDNVSVKLFDGRQYQVYLTPVYCVGKTFGHQLNGRVSFIGHDLLGQPKLVTSLLLRGTQREIYTEQCKAPIGMVIDPFTLNGIYAWLVNSTIERMEVN